MIVNNIPSLKEIIEIVKIRGFANTEEASLYLGLSIHYTRRLAREKVVNSFKPNGKCIYFKTEDLDSYLLKNNRLSNDKVSQKAAKYIYTAKY